MFCEKCGAEVAADSAFCTSCGAPVAAPAQPSEPQPTYSAPVQPQVTQPVKAATPGKGLAIAGMVLGIVSLLCFPYITGVLGVIFGAVAKSKGCKSGMATAGIACGIVGIVLWLLMLIACDSTALLFSEMLGM